MRTGRDEHGVRGDIAVADAHSARPGQACGPGDDLDALGRDARRDVGGLGLGQGLDAAVQPGRVDSGGAVGPQAQIRGAVQHRGCVGGLDQGLGRHAVGEHAGPAEPVPLGQRDLGAELRGDQRGLVAARAAADDRDPRA